jgi:hypothetical protein
VLDQEEALGYLVADALGVELLASEARDVGKRVGNHLRRAKDARKKASETARCRRKPLLKKTDPFVCTDAQEAIAAIDRDEAATLSAIDEKVHDLKLPAPDTFIDSTRGERKALSTDPDPEMTRVKAELAGARAELAEHDKLLAMLLPQVKRAQQTALRLHGLRKPPKLRADLWMEWSTECNRASSHAKELGAEYKQACSDQHDMADIVSLLALAQTELEMVRMEQQMEADALQLELQQQQERVRHSEELKAIDAAYSGASATDAQSDWTDPEDCAECCQAEYEWAEAVREAKAARTATRLRLYARMGPWLAV